MKNNNIKIIDSFSSRKITYLLIIQKFYDIFIFL